MITVLTAPSTHARALKDFATSLNHLTEDHPDSPLGGTDADKRSSSAQLTYVCLSLGHLAAKL